jgi:hypothetical protein
MSIETTSTIRYGASEKVTASGVKSNTALFWVVVGIPIALTVIAFPIMNSAFFLKYADAWPVSIQRGLFESSNRKCDILMFGDSSAESSLDPLIIENLTHLSTCNIAAGGPTFTVLGMDPFDQYLARNPKSQYLVLQFAPANLRTREKKVTDLDHFEGVIESIRYYGWAQTLPLMLRFPDYLIGLDNYIYKSGAREMALGIVGKRRRGYSGRPDSYVIYPDPKPSDTCPTTTTFLFRQDMPDAAWIAHLREKYADAADHVIVDVSPTSVCNPMNSIWKSALAGLTDNELPIYPYNEFADGFHPARAGGVRRSRELAEQILKMRDDETVKTPGTT